ncbi:O-antigen ligase family protein [Bacillus timonensis]|nr:O-antigen ligase family protein [Bacillus timonensis]
MNILQREYPILFFSLLLVTVGLLLENTMVGLVISLILAVLAFTNKNLGILMLIVFIPIRPFLITFNPGLKVLGDLIIVFLVLKVVFENRKNIRSLFSFQLFELAFFAFCIVGVVSAFITGVEVKSIIVQLRAYILFYLLYYVVKRMNISERLVKAFATTTFVTAIVMSLHGIVEKITSKTVLIPQAWQDAYWYLSWTNYIRVYGLIKGPNEFSLYLVIAFIVSLLLFNYVKGKQGRMLLYAGLTLIATVFILTYSRGTLLTLLAFLPIYFFFARRVTVKKFVPFIPVALVSVVLFFAIGQVTDYYYSAVVDPSTSIREGDEASKDAGANRFKDAFSDETLEQSTGGGRLYYVEKSLEIVKDHPIIGTGFGTFGGSATLAYSSPIYEDYNINRNFYSDNQYILALTETGILGILFLIVFGLSIVVFTWKYRKTFNASPLLVYFIVAIVISGLVYNIFENDTFMMYFYMVLGYVYYLSNQRKEAQS